MTSWLLAPFVYYETTERDFIAFELLGGSNFLIYETFYVSYLVLCLCYAYDLALTIKNPLYPAKKRLRWYIVWVVLSLLVLFGYEIYYYSEYYSGLSLKTFNDGQYSFAKIDNTYRWKVLLLLPISIFGILGPYSCIKAYLSLSEPGLG